MPNVEVRGRYRAFRYDGTTPLDFTTFSNYVSVIRRPNEISFVTLRQYIPGTTPPFTTFEPGSAYVIVSRNSDANFDMGPYTRVDRLPSSLNVKSPQYYLGLDKNSITIPLSVYALSINTPLSSVTGITYVNGVGAGQSTVTVDQIRNGFQTSFTHFLPNSGYQLRNRVPFTFFAPLQSEMGDAFAWGNNEYGQYGMGHLYSIYSWQTTGRITAERMYGVWENIFLSSNGSVYALSACGSKLKMFVSGNNINGKLGLGNEINRSTFHLLTGDWSSVASGLYHTVALSSNGKLFATGLNTNGQLGLGQNILSASTFTQVNENIYSKIAAAYLFSIALDNSGAIFGCGNNTYGQLGLGYKSDSVFTFTREASGGTFQSIAAGNALTVALSSGRMLGCGYQSTSTNYATNDIISYSTFVPEFYGFTDIEDVNLSLRYSIVKRGNDNNYWYFGGTGLKPSFQFSGETFYKYRLNKTVYSKYNNATLPVYDNTTGSTKFYFVYNNMLWYLQGAGGGQFEGNYSNFYTTALGRDQTFIALSATNNFRPTPTPTITPSPTPSPVPFAPYNTLEVGVFGSTFQSNSLTSSTQTRVYNTPGNLQNNFTFEIIQNNAANAGNSFITTYDYEKTTSYNNIVGIYLLTNASQSPAGRYYARNLVKKIGSTWSFSLLPTSFDAVSNSSLYSYRNIETGTDTLLITPPHPQYSDSTSQGIYNLMFMRDESFKEAISYDRGETWSINNFTYLNNEFQFSDLLGLKNKIFYSRTRGENYEVQAVGYTGSNSMGGFPDNTLYFSRRFPYFSSPELVFDFGTRYIWGFDFKHDYYNIPTIASAGATQSSFGIYLHRKINGSWQNNIIKDNITNLCYGPYYGVPRNLSFYKRANSPIISIEFDPTNSDIVYIAYLKHTLYFPNSFYDPGFINILCYNTATNTIIFDENVVSAKYESGSLYKTDSQYVDIPTLFYDISNNTLNLFFFGIVYDQANPSNIINKYYKMRRLGNNSWTSPNNLFSDPIFRGAYMTNSWELKTKY